MKINNSIACMRVLSCEIINKALSGHPGICLGISPMLYVLFKNHMKDAIYELFA
jgi:transketolase